MLALSKNFYFVSFSATSASTKKPTTSYTMQPIKSTNTPPVTMNTAMTTEVPYISTQGPPMSSEYPTVSTQAPPGTTNIHTETIPSSTGHVTYPISSSTPYIETTPSG